jgi:hypothetical protein
MRLAQRLRNRADTDPNLNEEKREDLRRGAWNLIRINEIEAKRTGSAAQPTSSFPDRNRHSRDELRRIFNEASAPMSDQIRKELAYRHMIAFADVLEGWALDKRLTPQQSVRVLGWAESLRTLAGQVGPDWDPPKPERLSLLGFLGRWALDEQ